MKMTVKVAAGVLVVALAGAQGARAADAKAASSSESTRPPKNLKLVGDHWTPWDPPQATADSYTIVKGDNFWDLSGKWLGNSYLWPQVWDQNRYVLDSHWIYPGDPLMVPGKPTVVPPEGPPPSAEKPPEPEQPPADNAAATAAAPPVEAPRPAAVPRPAMMQLADAHDLYCSGWIEPKHDPASLVIAGAELEKIGNGQQDIVYLNQGRNQGVNAGNEYLSVRADHKVVHPRTNDKMGVFVQRIGHLRVLCAQDDTAIALILNSCEDIRIGDELLPWKEMQGPAMDKLPPVDRCMQPSGLAQGYVVDGGSDQLHAVGAGHVVNSDIGAAAGIRPGSILTFYSDNGDLPRKVLGEGVVLTVDGDTSAVKVVQSAREVRLGDRVEVLQQ
jgi:hypothetical protein